jgi:hypothetical protein
MTDSMNSLLIYSAPLISGVRKSHQEHKIFLWNEAKYHMRSKNYELEDSERGKQTESREGTKCQ